MTCEGLPRSKREAASVSVRRLLIRRRQTAGTMILLSSHSHHAMGAADRDPAGGEIPVELIAISRLATSFGRGVEDKQAVT